METRKFIGNSLVERLNQQEYDGRPVHWGRVDDDGIPFLGKPLIVPEAEYQERVVRTAYSSSRLFDLTNADDYKDYHNLRNKHAARLAFIDHDERMISPDRQIVFAMWYDFFQEDGKGGKVPATAPLDIVPADLINAAAIPETSETAGIT